MSTYRKHTSLSSRINITLDLEQAGAKKKMELPLNLLVMDNFSSGKTTAVISEREKIRITSNNLDPILEKLQPELHLVVNNRLSPAAEAENKALEINLRFTKMADFRPEQLVNQIPALKKLLLIRGLLKELRTTVVDNTAFRKTLQKILQSPDEIETLKKQLPPIPGEVQ